jgi:hypothetical protein
MGWKEKRLTFLKSPSPKFGLRASFNSDRGRFTELGMEPRETSSGSRTSTMRTSCWSALSPSVSRSPVSLCCHRLDPPVPAFRSRGSVEVIQGTEEVYVHH